MKRGFAIMIAGLILLLTPMLAAAYDGHCNSERSGYHRQPVTERHQVVYRPASHRQWKQRQMKKQHRHMHHRQTQHYRQHRSYDSRPVVIAGFPSLIFRIDW